ncbi:hypothetical protein, partial [Campylobacter coli]|uniref:hypothetical protein n=1 Tax=Campylobacter coli TaxID=195 RepID=UPI001F091C6A
MDFQKYNIKEKQKEKGKKKKKRIIKNKQTNKKPLTSNQSTLRVCVALSRAHPVTLPVCKLGMSLSSPSWLCLA